MIHVMTVAPTILVFEGPDIDVYKEFAAFRKPLADVEAEKPRITSGLWGEQKVRDEYNPAIAKWNTKWDQTIQAFLEFWGASSEVEAFHLYLMKDKGFKMITDAKVW